MEFSKHGHADAAGKEFQDLKEAVEHLQATGVASDRVGITGGSYGGYATAWCSTYYTDVFKAGVAAADQNCGSCALYQGEGDVAPCTLFQGRNVMGSGWCTAWVPRG